MKHFKEPAFTLPELAVALTILGILGVLVVPRAASFLVQARRGEAKVNLEHIKSLQAIYRLEHGSASSGWMVGYDGSVNRCNDNDDKELLNPLGFAPKGCDKLRYSYYVDGTKYYAYGASNKEGKWIYPDCQGGGTAPDDCTDSATAGDKLETSDSDPIKVCRNITKYCPGGGAGSNTLPSTIPTPKTCANPPSGVDQNCPTGQQHKNSLSTITLSASADDSDYDSSCCENTTTYMCATPPSGINRCANFQAGQENQVISSSINQATYNSTCCATLTCDNPPAGIDDTCSSGYTRVSGKNSDSFTSTNQGVYDTACCSLTTLRCADASPRTCTGTHSRKEWKDANTGSTEAECCECSVTQPSGTNFECPANTTTITYAWDATAPNCCKGTQVINTVTCQQYKNNISPSPTCGAGKTEKNPLPPNINIPDLATFRSNCCTQSSTCTNGHTTESACNAANGNWNTDNAPNCCTVPPSINSTNCSDYKIANSTITCNNGWIEITPPGTVDITSDADFKSTCCRIKNCDDISCSGNRQNQTTGRATYTGTNATIANCCMCKAESNLATACSGNEPVYDSTEVSGDCCNAPSNQPSNQPSLPKCFSLDDERDGRDRDESKDDDTYNDKDDKEDYCYCSISSPYWDSDPNNDGNTSDGTCKVENPNDKCEQFAETYQKTNGDNYTKRTLCRTAPQSPRPGGGDGWKNKPQAQGDNITSDNFRSKCCEKMTCLEYYESKQSIPPIGKNAFCAQDIPDDNISYSNGYTYLGIEDDGNPATTETITDALKLNLMSAIGAIAFKETCCIPPGSQIAPCIPVCFDGPPYDTINDSSKVCVSDTQKCSHEAVNYGDTANLTSCCVDKECSELTLKQRCERANGSYTPNTGTDPITGNPVGSCNCGEDTADVAHYLSDCQCRVSFGCNSVRTRNPPATCEGDDHRGKWLRAGDDNHRYYSGKDGDPHWWDACCECPDGTRVTGDPIKGRHWRSRLRNPPAMSYTPRCTCSHMPSTERNCPPGKQWIVLHEGTVKRNIDEKPTPENCCKIVCPTSKEPKEINGKMLDRRGGGDGTSSSDAHVFFYDSGTENENCYCPADKPWFTYKSPVGCKASITCSEWATRGYDRQQDGSDLNRYKDASCGTNSDYISNNNDHTFSDPNDAQRTCCTPEVVNPINLTPLTMHCWNAIIHSLKVSDAHRDAKGSSNVNSIITKANNDCFDSPIACSEVETVFDINNYHNPSGTKSVLLEAISNKGPLTCGEGTKPCSTELQAGATNKCPSLNN